MTNRCLTKLDFVALLGDSFPAILAASKASVDVEMFVKMLDWATPDPDSTSVDLDDPRVSTGLTMLEAGGLLPTGKAQEILGPVMVLDPAKPSVGVYLLENQITIITEGENPPDTFLKFWPLSAAIATLVDSGAAQVRVVGESIEIVSVLS